MNNQFFQQAEHFFKPMTEIMALNARTFEALAERQTSLISDVWTDGLNCVKDLSDKRDVESFYTSQKNFWESVNQKFSSTAQDSYALLTEAQEKMTELVQDSISSVDIQSAAEPFVKSAYRAQDAAQHTAKTAAKTAQKTQSQAARNAGKAAESAS